MAISGFILWALSDATGLAYLGKYIAYLLVLYENLLKYSRFTWQIALQNKLLKYSLEAGLFKCGLKLYHTLPYPT